MMRTDASGWRQGQTGPVRECMCEGTRTRSGRTKYGRTYTRARYWRGDINDGRIRPITIIIIRFCVLRSFANNRLGRLGFRVRKVRSTPPHHHRQKWDDWRERQSLHVRTVLLPFLFCFINYRSNVCTCRWWSAGTASDRRYTLYKSNLRRVENGLRARSLIHIIIVHYSRFQMIFRPPFFLRNGCDLREVQPLCFLRTFQYRSTFSLGQFLNYMNSRQPLVRVVVLTTVQRMWRQRLFIYTYIYIYVCISIVSVKTCNA